MWRCVARLSSLIPSSKTSLPNQLANGLKIMEAFSTEILKPAKGQNHSREKPPFITFVLGGPGSGKGTQCLKIVETFGLTHLSAGDLLRKEISSNSEHGAMILETIRQGKIVPSEVTVKLIQRAIELSDNNKFLIDGFPRCEENRRAYERVIGAEPNIVLFFDCPEEEMVKRVLSRNQGRVDDNIDTVKKRIEVFNTLNLPVINYYSEKGKLYKIHAVGPEEEIFERVRPIFITLETLLSNAMGNKIRSISSTFGSLLGRGDCFHELRLFPEKRSNKMLEALDGIVNDLESSVEKGIRLDPQTFASLLETCFQLQAIDYGFRIHRLIPEKLLRKNVGLSSKLLRLYASGGHIENAHQVFDQMSKRNNSVFAWNSLISGYAELGLYEDALALYFQMDEEGVEPDRFTFPRVLKACSGIGLIRIGEEVHRHIVRYGFWYDGFVLNGLVDMYAKCGDIVKSRRVFDKIAVRDLVSWNSMLTGYVHRGLLAEALGIFRQMIQEGCEPDSVSISTILTGVASLKLGSQVHGWTLKKGFEWGLSVANSLIVLYSNHGKLDRARWVFDKMPERDVVSWNSIISAHCNDPKALLYFSRMETFGTLPDSVTFVSLLSACAHLGLVKDGERLFLLMRERYGISPVMEHYACMVNLFGRAGLIDEAYEIVSRMEFRAGPTVWGALLYACYLHGNVDVGEVAAQRLFELEPDNEHNFELLMNIYGNAGRLEDVERVRTMMVERGLDSSVYHYQIQTKMNQF
ncbi:Pentatricopeptide repeat-containing protein [Actinidia chinensis var. chinensis]|uniref:adenylate kinase n=1 Tax=Actinidia chinensis var. chinensis TaxID=1590841 RepID=A0A2R6PM04_ACTCC|nr:Pentatricopeptide repeat-containing protein [Actinidia chinensis var. chinensis]